MKNQKPQKRKTWLLTLSIIMTAIVSLSLINTTFATNNNLKKIKGSSTPKLHGGTADNGYIVFVANGRFESVDGSILKDGIVNGDGLNFQKNVMNRTNDEINELRQEAINFFNQRFGIDVETNTSIIFTGYEMDPRINLKAFTVSGEKVPANGYPVDDGGWAIIITDPAGITLGGSWDGFHIPANSMLLFGEVVINTDSDIINVHYESDTPFVLDQFNAAQVRFKSENNKFGEGSIGGIARLNMLNSESLLLQVDIKNILTAPGILSEF